MQAHVRHGTKVDSSGLSDLLKLLFHPHYSIFVIYHCILDSSFQNTSLFFDNCSSLTLLNEEIKVFSMLAIRRHKCWLSMRVSTGN